MDDHAVPLAEQQHLPKTFQSPLVLAVGRETDAKIQAARILALVAVDPDISARPEVLAEKMGMTEFGVIDLLGSEEFRKAVSVVLRHRVELTMGYVHDDLVAIIKDSGGKTSAAAVRNRIAAAKTLITLRACLAKEEADGTKDTAKQRAQAVGEAVLEMIKLQKNKTTATATATVRDHDASPPSQPTQQEDD